MTSWRSRDLHPSDLPAFADFVDLIFVDLNHGRPSEASSGLDAHYYDWKYFGSPIHPACVRVAVDGQRIVGSVAATFKRLQIDGERSLCVELGDLFTHPDFRYQGIFKTLTSETLAAARAAGAELAYVRPNDNSFPGLVKLGFTQVFPLITRLRILDVEPTLARKLRWRPLTRACLPAARLINHWLHREAGAEIPVDLEITDVQRVDERFDHLWTRCATARVVGIVRDREFVSWRYVKSPVPYTILAAERGGELVGWAVIRRTGLHGTAHLVDLLADETNPGLPDAVLAAVLRWLIGAGVDVTLSWVRPDSAPDRLLRRQGFRQCGAGRHFVLMPWFNDDRKRIRTLEADAWTVLYGDTDGI